MINKTRPKGYRITKNSMQNQQQVGCKKSCIIIQIEKIFYIYKNNDSKQNIIKRIITLANIYNITDRWIKEVIDYLKITFEVVLNSNFNKMSIIVVRLKEIMNIYDTILEDKLYLKIHSH